MSEEIAEVGVGGGEAPVEDVVSREAQADFDVAKENAAAEAEAEKPVEAKAEVVVAKASTPVTPPPTEKSEQEAKTELKEASPQVAASTTAKSETPQASSTEAKADASNAQSANTQLPENAENRTKLLGHEISSSQNEDGTHNNYITVGDKTTQLSSTQNAITNADVNGAMKDEVLAAIRTGNEKPTVAGGTASVAGATAALAQSGAATVGTPSTATSDAATQTPASNQETDSKKPTSQELKFANNAISELEEEVKKQKATVAGQSWFESAILNNTVNKGNAEEAQKKLADSEQALANAKEIYNKAVATKNSDVTSKELLGSINNANQSGVAATTAVTKSEVAAADQKTGAFVTTAAIGTGVVAAPVILTTATTAGAAATAAGASAGGAGAVAVGAGTTATGVIAVGSAETYRAATEIGGDLQGVDASGVADKLAGETRNSVLFSGASAGAGQAANGLSALNKTLATNIANSGKPLTGTAQKFVHGVADIPLQTADELAATASTTLKDPNLGQRLLNSGKQFLDNSGISELVSLPAQIPRLIGELGNSAKLALINSGSAGQFAVNAADKLGKTTAGVLGVATTLGATHGSWNTAFVQSGVQSPNAQSVSFTMPKDRSTLEGAEAEVAKALGSQALPGQQVDAKITKDKIFGAIDTSRISASVSGLGKQDHTTAASITALEVGSSGYVGANGQKKNAELTFAKQVNYSDIGGVKSVSAASLSSQNYTDTTIGTGGISNTQTNRFIFVGAGSTMEFSGIGKLGTSLVAAPVTVGGNGSASINPVRLYATIAPSEGDANKTRESLGVMASAAEQKGQDALTAMGNTVQTATASIGNMGMSTWTAINNTGRDVLTAMIPQQATLQAQNTTVNQPRA